MLSRGVRKLKIFTACENIVESIFQVELFNIDTFISSNGYLFFHITYIIIPFLRILNSREIRIHIVQVKYLSLLYKKCTFILHFLTLMHQKERYEISLKYTKRTIERTYIIDYSSPREPNVSFPITISRAHSHRRYL